MTTIHRIARHSTELLLRYGLMAAGGMLAAWLLFGDVPVGWGQAINPTIAALPDAPSLHLDIKVEEGSSSLVNASDALLEAAVTARGPIQPPAAKSHGGKLVHTALAIAGWISVFADDTETVSGERAHTISYLPECENVSGPTVTFAPCPSSDRTTVSVSLHEGFLKGFSPWETVAAVTAFHGAVYLLDNHLRKHPKWRDGPWSDATEGGLAVMNGTAALNDAKRVKAAEKAAIPPGATDVKID